jgi:hypothetical protein
MGLNPKTAKRRSSAIPMIKGKSVNGRKLKKHNNRKLTKGRISFRQGLGLMARLTQQLEALNSQKTGGTDDVQQTGTY